MAEERQFLAPTDDAFTAVEQAARELEKLRETDRQSKVVKFETKMGVISNGSKWAVTIQPFGSGSLATAEYLKGLFTIDGVGVGV